MPRLTLSRSFYLPKAYPLCKVSERSGLGVVYLYQYSETRLAAVAFVGKASKPAWHLTFRTAAQRETRVRELFEGLRQHQASKLAARAQAAQPHTLQLGAIVYNSWGYEQTNVDWYVVVGVSANYVQLREIASEIEDGTGPMSGTCSPVINTTAKDSATWGVTFAKDATITRHRVYHYGSGNSVNFKHGGGSEWDGRAQHVSWYA